MQPAFCPNKISVSNLSPTIHILEVLIWYLQNKLRNKCKVFVEYRHTWFSHSLSTFVYKTEHAMIQPKGLSMILWFHALQHTETHFLPLLIVEILWLHFDFWTRFILAYKNYDDQTNTLGFNMKVGSIERSWNRMKLCRIFNWCYLLL